MDDDRFEVRAESLCTRARADDPLGDVSAGAFVEVRCNELSAADAAELVVAIPSGLRDLRAIGQGGRRVAGMMPPEPPSDVDRARELLETAKLQNISDRMLAAAQVHASLAVETAVRELIDKLEGQDDR